MNKFKKGMRRTSRSPIFNIGVGEREITSEGTEVTRRRWGACHKRWVLIRTRAHYSRLQNRCPRGPENLRAAAGCQTGAHGHFPTKNSPSPFHITYLQALKSFSEPYITEISTFHASILIFCSSYWSTISVNVIWHQVVSIAAVLQPLWLPHRPPSGSLWE